LLLPTIAAELLVAAAAGSVTWKTPPEPPVPVLTPLTPALLPFVWP
jgi:hypothetical protein